MFAGEGVIAGGMWTADGDPQQLGDRRTPLQFIEPTQRRIPYHSTIKIASEIRNL